MSNAHFSLEAHASRPLNRARIAISNSHQFKRVLQAPMKAWTKFGGIDGKNERMCDTPKWQDTNRSSGFHREEGGNAYKLLLKRF